MLRFLGWWLLTSTIYGLMSQEWILSILGGLVVSILIWIYGTDPRGGL
jgi:hypothetical protein